MECRVTRNTQNKLTVIEETPHYYAAVEVDVLDRRDPNSKTESMNMYFEVTYPSLDDAYRKMHDILHSLGYHLCGQGALVIVESPNDSENAYHSGKPKIEK